jgi:hypothetical protein
MTFRQFVATIRQKGFVVGHDVSPQRVNDWFADDHRRKVILGARRAFLARQPKPADAFLESHTHEESSSNENELLFTSKIAPNFEADIANAKSGPSRYRTEAMLAASNLPGWAEQIAKYAKANFRDFFVALGRALASKRTLWDATDERILCNYFSSAEFESPLSEMTEEKASNLLGMTTTAYDKRLQRLGILRKGGRPKKQDRTLRRRS